MKPQSEIGCPCLDKERALLVAGDWVNPTNG